MRTHINSDLTSMTNTPAQILRRCAVLLCCIIFTTPIYANENLLLDRILVTVDEDIILESELQDQLALIKNQMQQRKVSLPPENILRKQLLERMILDNIQTQMANRAGIRIDDEQVNETMSKIAAQNGQTLLEFQESLSSQGVSYPIFRKQIHLEVLLNRLQQRRVSQRISISDQDIQHFLASPQAQSTLSADYYLYHLLIALPEKPEINLVKEKERFIADLHKQLTEDPARFESIAASYSDGQYALKGGDLGWRSAVQLPGLFLEQAEQLSKGEVSAPFRSPSGYHLLLLKDKRGGSEIFVPQTKVRHILIKPNQIRSDQQSFQLVNDLHQQIQSGANFEELARTYSDDPGSALNGGELGWITPDTLTEKFAEVMQNTSTGQLSSPFRSRFGWHVLEVLERRKQDMSEDYRKNQAKNILYKKRFTEELQSWLREIRQDAYVDYKS